MAISKRALAKTIAMRADDAYSRDRYSDASWWSCAALLLRRGFRENEVEQVLRSRWMRAAADFAGFKVNDATSGDLARYLDDNRYTPRSWRAGS